MLLTDGVVADAPTTLTVRPWEDDVIDRLGVDPRSTYVERCWLPILGPSSVLLLRRLAAELEVSPEGVELDVEETARSLGLSSRGGRTSPFLRTISRCCTFRLCTLHRQPLDGERAELRARRRLPPLSRPQVARLPEGLQRYHAAWVAQRPVATGA